MSWLSPRSSVPPILRQSGRVMDVSWLKRRWSGPPILRPGGRVTDLSLFQPRSIPPILRPGGRVTDVSWLERRSSVPPILRPSGRVTDVSWLERRSSVPPTLRPGGRVTDVSWLSLRSRDPLIVTRLRKVTSKMPQLPRTRSSWSHFPLSVFVSRPLTVSTPNSILFFVSLIMLSFTTLLPRLVDIAMYKIRNSPRSRILVTHFSACSVPQAEKSNVSAMISLKHRF